MASAGQRANITANTDVNLMDLTTLLQQQGKSAEATAVFAKAGNS